MFSKREYEYVMEIAKEGSFSKAAQKLYIPAGKYRVSGLLLKNFLPSQFPSRIHTHAY